MNTKTMYIVFGPIASGKSHVIPYVAPSIENIEYLSADAYKKAFFEVHVNSEQATLNGKKAYRCADELLFLRIVDLCEQQKSFVLELCPTNRNKLELIKYYAKLYKYKIVSFFVGTNDVKLNIDRNRSRMNAGGDYVSDEKVQSRYESSFNSVLEIACISHTTYFIDNSKSDKPPFVVAILRRKKFVIFNNKCEWFNKKIKQKLST